MKKKLIVLIALLAVCLTGFACTTTESNHDGKVKVIYELEGGVYRNSSRPVVLYFEFEEGTQNLMPELTEVTKGEITRAGFEFVGWYAKKEVNGSEVVYSEPWDFENDKVTDAGVTLYAKWKIPYKYTYKLCYNDGQDVKVLYEYEVSSGERFDDYMGKANSRYGFTAIGFKDAEGNPWDESFTHPGGEGNVEVQVFVDYLVGNYSLVRTKNELKLAKKSNIYLMANIDMGGDALDFGDYDKIFEGNNHIISNFTINYDDSKSGLKPDLDDGQRNNSYFISLFGRMKNATVRNVNFENVTMKVGTRFSSVEKIYFSPICCTMVNSTIQNVTLSGTFTMTELHAGLDPLNDVVTDLTLGYIQKDEESTVGGVAITVNQNEEQPA